MLYTIFIFINALLLCSSEKGIASKQQSEKIQQRCPYKLRKLWHADVSTFPFAASPLVVDVDGDGGLDVVAAPFGEALAVIEGETGKHLHDTSWPQINLDKSVHSSPLQYDIDGDGVLDLLFITSQGEGLFYTGWGYALHKYTFQIPHVYVSSTWFNDVPRADHVTIYKYLTVKPVSNLYIPVDPHVLGTPVMVDRKLLVVPVSFYFSDDDYDDSDSGPWGKEDIRDKFYVVAVAVIDLQELYNINNKDEESELREKSATPYIKFFHLELSQTPVFNLFSPVVADVDGEFGPEEIITSSTSGSVFLFSFDGKHRAGFPQNVGSVSGPVTIADLTNDGRLELVVTNSNGSIICLSSQTGKVLWSQAVGGSNFGGSRVVDINLDGQLDVIIATEEGKVFALDGVNGSVLPKYPYNAGRRISGRVLITKFNAFRGPIDLVFLSDDGILHLLAGDLSCLSQVALADTTLVDILSNNVMLLNRGTELIVATLDGSLICLGCGTETPPEELVEEEFRLMDHRLAYPMDSSSQNDFLFSMEKTVVLIEERTRYLKEVTGSSLDLYFTIHGHNREDKFDLKVYMGSQLMHEENQITRVSAPAWVTVRTPEKPGQAMVTVVVYDRHGFCSSDSIHLKFNQLILLDLQWLVLAPFIAMVVILLVNHGFPAKDLLPVTFPFKSK